MGEPEPDPPAPVDLNYAQDARRSYPFFATIERCICWCGSCLLIWTLLMIGPRVSYLVCFLGGTIWLASFFLALGMTPGSYNPRRHPLKIGASLLLMTLSISALVTRWPLKLGFAAFYSQFETVADQVAVSPSSFKPQSVGPWWVVAAEVRQGCVCLWIDDDRNGPTGFVRHPISSRYRFNVATDTDVSPTWQFTEED